MRKPFSVRLSDEEYLALHAASFLTGTSMADLVRQAVRSLVAEFVASGEAEARFSEVKSSRDEALEVLASFERRRRG